MQIRDGIYYYWSGNQIYLRNVNTHQDYLFNDIVFDILETLRNPTDETDLGNHLLKMYEINDEKVFRQDIHSFTAYLIQEGILEADVPDRPDSENQVPSIRSTVEMRCMEENKLCYATLELTYRCNERCIHCYVDGMQPVDRELMMTEYEQLLRDLRELGCFRVLLTGGEVCLKPEFLEITRLAVSLGMLVDIYTNGIALDMKIFQTLCDLHINSVSFSLYGGDAASHDAITKVPGSFDRTLHYLTLFRCAGVDTYIKTVAIRQNVKTLESLYQLGKRLQIPVETAFSIADTQTGQSAQAFRLGEYSAYYEALKADLRYKNSKKKAFREVWDLGTPVCLAGRASLSVDPYGGVHPCVAFSELAGNIRAKPLAEIWGEAELFRRLRSLTFRDICPTCESCADAEFCQLCPGDAYRGEDGFCPGEEACLLARALRANQS